MLKSYLASLPDDAARKAFAMSCGTSLGHLRNCIYAPDKQLAPAACVLVERNSGRLVRRWHLRDDWREIWPELESHPDAPDRPIVGAIHHSVTAEAADPRHVIGTPAAQLEGQRHAA